MNATQKKKEEEKQKEKKRRGGMKLFGISSLLYVAKAFGLQINLLTEIFKQKAFTSPTVLGETKIYKLKNT